MKSCLIIDVETNGLDPIEHRVIEIGAVLYSIEHQAVISQVSGLLQADSNPCESINRIPAALLASPRLWNPMPIVESLATEAGCFVAHNAEFDRGFLLPMQSPFSSWGSLPWLCTMSDFAWPRATKDGGSLINLALDHGIGVSSAHRALTDCQLIAALFDRMTDLPGMFAHAMRPKAMFRANVSYDDRELAKAAGFKWHPENKTWTRRMAIEDAAKLAFPVVQLGEC